MGCDLDPDDDAGRSGPYWGPTAGAPPSRSTTTIFLFYAFLAAGVVALVSDIRGSLTVSPEGVRRWRRIGVAAAAGPGVAPTLAWLLGRFEVEAPFQLAAITYLACFLLVAVGALGPAREPTATQMRRVGYAGILVLAAAPSMVLLLLTPFVAVAGAALVRPIALRPGVPGSAPATGLPAEPAPLR